MNASSPPRRWSAPSRGLSALLLAGLLATLTLAVVRADLRADATLRALGGWLQAGSWAWPLAAALTLAAVASPPAHQRWPRRAHRIPVAIGIFAALVGLTSLAVDRPGVAVLAVGVLVLGGLVAIWVVVLPRQLAPSLPKTDLDAVKDPDRRLELADNRTRLQNDLRTTTLQAVAGLAVLAGAVLGFQQLSEDRQQATATQELTRQGQASERFTRAIDQLGSRRREVQLGGIYGLEQIAQQAPDNRLVVTEVLVAYLHRRVHRPLPPLNPWPMRELRDRAPDVQAALTVLGRRKIAPTDPRLDLRRLDLRHAGLGGAILGGAALVGTDLRLADLRGADLGGADLGQADLRLADLRGADLRLADLRTAILIRADLRGADLRDADLVPAFLRGALADQETRWPDGFDWRGAGVRA